jgi:hypothetical protein
VLLGFQVRPVGDENLTIGLQPQRLRAARRAQATSELRDTRGLHLLGKRVDIADHRFVHCGRVEVVGELNSNQIFRHVFSCNHPSGGVLCPAFTTTTNGQTGILQAVGKILFLGIF